jgi:tRNA (guanine6-N2)-methyltransferase
VTASNRHAVQLLATTNPGLESVAADEIRELTGADPRHRYRGAVSFEADESAIYRLNRRGRTIHRVMVLLVDRPFEDLDHVEELVGSLQVDRYFGPGQTFGVRPTRHGEHDFTSVDVGDVTGQAVIDSYRASSGVRPEVDLDDPDATFRAFVRDEQFFFAVDATGERSLHRRWYRECEHNAPLRPTIAASMVRLAEFSPGDDLVDPTCGSATIPIEAALGALERPPHRDREYADEWLPFLDPEGWTPPEPDSRDPDDLGTVRGVDARDRWVRCGRVNAGAADLDEVVSVESGDARTTDLDAEAVVANLPYGIRTIADDLGSLYGDVSENLQSSDWERAVFLTTRPDLLDLPVDRKLPVRLGRIEASVVVASR